jgi:hypothetical protein
MACHYLSSNKLQNVAQFDDCHVTNYELKVHYPSEHAPSPNQFSMLNKFLLQNLSLAFVYQIKCVIRLDLYRPVFLFVHLQVLGCLVCTCVHYKLPWFAQVLCVSTANLVCIECSQVLPPTHSTRYILHSWQHCTRPVDHVYTCHPHS